MSKTLDQIFIANPITSNASTDLMYFSQSPYTAGHDVAMTYANFSAQFGAPYTAAALTKTDDTNVTLTLGGTPATALLHAASITAGWTGTLAVSRGGIGSGSATAYAVICGGTTSTGALQSVASVGTAGQVLTSNGAGALPTFQAAGGGGGTPDVKTNYYNATVFAPALPAISNTSYSGTNTQIYATYIGYFQANTTINWVRFLISNLAGGGSNINTAVAQLGILTSSSPPSPTSPPALTLLAQGAVTLPNSTAGIYTNDSALGASVVAGTHVWAAFSVQSAVSGSVSHAYPIQDGNLGHALIVASHYLADGGSPWTATLAATVSGSSLGSKCPYMLIYT